MNWKSTVLSCIACLFIVSGGGLHASADERDDAVMARAMELLQWAAAKTGYSADYVRPVILFRNQETLNRLYYGQNYREDGSQLDVMAAAMGNTIILRDDFTVGRDDSTLAHELVHVLQNENAAEFPCHSVMEYEAYDLQDQFVAEFGYGEKADPFWKAMMMTCPTHYGLP